MVVVELRAFVTKNKAEILERYKGLVQSNYKEPANGNFDDKLKKIVKSAIRKQDQKDFFKDRKLQF